jgi:hypothetical protein
MIIGYKKKPSSSLYFSGLIAVCVFIGFAAARSAAHGIIFAAACDFSKASRDAFYAWCRDQGISEAVIWGKGELEGTIRDKGSRSLPVKTV